MAACVVLIGQRLVLHKCGSESLLYNGRGVGTIYMSLYSPFACLGGMPWKKERKPPFHYQKFPWLSYPTLRMRRTMKEAISLLIILITQPIVAAFWYYYTFCLQRVKDIVPNLSFVVSTVDKDYSENYKKIKNKKKLFFFFKSIYLLLIRLYNFRALDS